MGHTMESSIEKKKNHWLTFNIQTGSSRHKDIFSGKIKLIADISPFCCDTSVLNLFLKTCLSRPGENLPPSSTHHLHCVAWMVIKYNCCVNCSSVFCFNPRMSTRFRLRWCLASGQHSSSRTIQTSGLSASLW